MLLRIPTFIRDKPDTMKHRDTPYLLPIDEHAYVDYQSEAPGCWEPLTPYLIDILVNKDESRVHWPRRFKYRTPSRSEVARQELRRMSQAADQHAQRKHIALALSGRDLSPLFDICQEDPFFRQLAKLLQVADAEQRVVLLEGVGPMLLEAAHGQGWMQSLDVPDTGSDASRAAASRKVAEFCADYQLEREAHAQRPSEVMPAQARVKGVQQDESKRREQSEASATRAKQWAVSAAKVKAEDWLTTKEFSQRAGLAEWEFNRLKKTGAIPFTPLQGPKGAPLLWRKTEVAKFIALRSKKNHERNYTLRFAA
jgi:hypothetical protein